MCCRAVNRPAEMCWLETFSGSLLFGLHCVLQASGDKFTHIFFLDSFQNDLLPEARKYSTGFSGGYHKARALQHNDHETEGAFADMTVMGWQGIEEDLGLES